MAGIGKKSRWRGKHKKNKNRYNPSKPNWAEVHTPAWLFLRSNIGAITYRQTT